MINRKQLISVAILVALLAGVPLSVVAQTKKGATRIRFKRGDSSTTIRGQLTSRRLERVYLVRSRAGQELYLQIKARTNDGLDFAILQVYDPLGKPLGTAQDNLRIHLKRTGDYRIEVSPPGSFYREDLKGYKQMQFTLSLSIQ